MGSVQVIDLKGKSVGELALADEVFAQEVSQHTMHLALIRQLANARSGSANTKTRAEVSGGGRKPWRQKGTGRARVGSIRSPLWRKGGVIFGPKPRDYSLHMPKKMRQLAIKSALAVKQNDFIVIESFADWTKAEHVKTKTAFALLEQLEIAGKSVLVLLDPKASESPKLTKAFRNIARVEVNTINNLNVKSLIGAEVILASQDTVKALNTLFTVHKKEDSAQPAKSKKSEKAVEEKAPKKETKAAKTVKEGGAKKGAEKAKGTKKSEKAE